MTPSQEHRRCRIEKPRKVLNGLDAAADRAWGTYQRRGAVLAALLAEADAIVELEKRYKDVSDHRLKEQIAHVREVFRRYPGTPERLEHHALASIREAAARALGMRPFPVQLAGALALHRGFLAEMATGEGKTLTAGLAATMAAWRGFPCHVITVNDYLAERDADWIGPLYAFCGVSVGSVTGEMDAARRKQGYRADVAYCTGKEIVADFLRDRLRLGRVSRPTSFEALNLVMPHLADSAGVVLRGLHTAIVDEADSVMIDEAVTPVIIASPRPNDALREACRLAHTVAASLRAPGDYTIESRYREVELTPAGEAKVADTCGSLPGLWRGRDRRAELVRQALTAREFFHEGKQYVVQDGKVVIVDEFTGRIMPQRTWREGLHQAIEAKQGLAISEPSETLARVSFQRFFRLFKRLAGMTGTAREAADEFWHVYRLRTVPIPSNKPCVRMEAPARFFEAEEAKWGAVVEEIARVQATGRPVLIGTRSVDSSEMLAARLVARGLKHQVLNAVRHKEEARIVAGAGTSGAITIATNMAGRGTDIKLGRGVAELGGLHVIATERHESGRIDRQLSGRCARQGDPGTAQAFVCVEDEIFKRFLPAAVQKRLGWLLNSGGMPGRRIVTQCLEMAQAHAQRMAAAQRRAVLGADAWTDDALSFAGEEL